MFILFALLVAFFGATPLLLAKKINASAIFVVVAFIISWPLLYLAVPSTVWPMFGMIGLFAVISSGVGLIIVILADDNDQILVPAIPFAVVILGFMISGISGCDFANAKEYSNLIGDVEKREWTQDIQPKDPKHIRLVPVENAIFVANKQLGGAEQGAIGSQFEIDSHNVTLQLINEDLWYILPLDFSGYSTWSSTGSAPGYIMVHAEDPNRPPILKLKEKFVYTPNAFFGENLIRHVWSNGYRNKGLTDVNMEIDENGKAWWIINIYEPTISFWGEKTIGIVLVDPTDGKIEFREVGNIPSWVDRAIPKSFIKYYIEQSGKFSGGWLNSWWGKKDITEPEEPTIIYGSDKEPYWVTAVTSTNANDESMVGLYYTNTRTGKSVFYHAKGSTESGALMAVNNKVSYKKQHGSGPVLYNVYGTMAYIVPVLGEHHTYQGVAIVNVDNLVTAVGENEYEAYREYQKELSKIGQSIAPETAHDFSVFEGSVSRISNEVKENSTLYYIYSKKMGKIFIGGSELSPKLVFTKEGDMVTIQYIESTEDVLPMVGFNNKDINISPSLNQKILQKEREGRMSEVSTEKSNRSARGELKNMSDEEVQELLKLKKKQ